MVIPSNVTTIFEPFDENPNLTQIIVLGKSEDNIVWDEDNYIGFYEGWNAGAEVIFKP